MQQEKVLQMVQMVLMVLEQQQKYPLVSPELQWFEGQLHPVFGIIEIMWNYI